MQNIDNNNRIRRSCNACNGRNRVFSPESRARNNKYCMHTFVADDNNDNNDNENDSYHCIYIIDMIDVILWWYIECIMTMILWSNLPKIHTHIHNIYINYYCFYFFSHYICNMHIDAYAFLCSSIYWMVWMPTWTAKSKIHAIHPSVRSFIHPSTVKYILYISIYITSHTKIHSYIYHIRISHSKYSNIIMNSEYTCIYMYLNIWPQFRTQSVHTPSGAVVLVTPAASFIENCV